MNDPNSSITEDDLVEAQEELARLKAGGMPIFNCGVKEYELLVAHLKKVLGR